MRVTNYPKYPAFLPAVSAELPLHPEERTPFCYSLAMMDIYPGIQPAQ
jgi:hypothetical protein